MPSSGSPTAPSGSATPSTFALVAAFAAVYVIWGSTYLAIRFAVETIPPFTMAGIRFLVAGGLAFVWLRARGAAAPTRRHWIASTIAGGLLLLGGNGAVVWAEQWVPSGATALLVATVPFWMVLLEWASGQASRPNSSVLLGLVVGMVGVWLLVGDASAGFDDPQWRLGVLAILFGAFSWAVGSIYGRGSHLPTSPWMATALQMIGGGALLSLFGIGLGELGEWTPSESSLKSWIALGYLIVFGALVAFSAFVWLMRVSTAAAVSTYAYVNPAVALALGWLFADEPFTPRMALASAVILGAVVAVHRAQRKVDR